MISPLASIHPECKTGQQCNHRTILLLFIDNVTIGDGTHIMSHAVIIFIQSRIGKECRIFPGAVIGAVPQDLKFVGEETTVEIGDNTTIRECVTIQPRYKG